jgi:hypothetical protein
MKKLQIKFSTSHQSVFLGQISLKETDIYKETAL